MGTKNACTDLEKSCMLLMQIVEEKERENAELKNRMSNTKPIQNEAENEAVLYFKLFRKFLAESMSQKWSVERKYATELSQNYVDVYFEKYKQFIDNNLDRRDHKKFRYFLVDLQLVDRATFEKERGLLAGSEKNRKRVVRIRAEVYKSLTAGYSPDG